MGTKYASGRRFEWSVRDKLRKAGFLVYRLAGSKPYDLIIVREGSVLIVECKIMPQMNKPLLNFLHMKANLNELPFLVVFSTNNGIEAYIVGSYWNKNIEEIKGFISQEIGVKTWV